jgi:hypothetical protein
LLKILLNKGALILPDKAPKLKSEVEGFYYFLSFYYPSFLSDYFYVYPVFTASVGLLLLLNKLAPKFNPSNKLLFFGYVFSSELLENNDPIF